MGEVWSESAQISEFSWRPRLDAGVELWSISFVHLLEPPRPGRWWCCGGAVVLWVVGW